MKTPKPETVKVICDTCGLDWSLHGEKPTLEKCVELLKFELAKPRPITQPYIPWTVTPQPIYPYRPYITQPNTARPFGPYFNNPISIGSAANSTAVTYRFTL